jgi:hypothetical protein
MAIDVDADRGLTGKRPFSPLGVRTVFAIFLLGWATLAHGDALAAVTPADPSQLATALAQQVPGILTVTASPSPTGHGTELVFRVAIKGATPAGGDIASAMWKAGLVAAAANSEYATSGLSPVTEVNVSLVAPNGAETKLGGGLGKPPANTAFDPVTPDLLLAISNRCGSLGLTNISVTSVLGAIVIVASSSDPTSTMQSLSSAGDVLTDLVGQDPSSFEGVYFELDDSSGAALYVNGLATLAGAHMGYTSPSLGSAGGSITAGGGLAQPSPKEDLVATVSDGGQPSLKENGKPVSTLTAGRYKLTSKDTSRKTGFVLRKGKGQPITLTGTRFFGTNGKVVDLTAGHWTLVWGKSIRSFVVTGS